MKRSFTIILLIILAVLVYPNMRRRFFGHSSTISVTRVDISHFKTALNMFDVEHGRYPTKAEGLESLINRPATIPEGGKWHRYLDADKLPNDPWGRRYVYEIPGKHNPDGYDVYSLGPHGKGGDEAIGNWTPPPDVNR